MAYLLFGSIGTILILGSVIAQLLNISVLGDLLLNLGVTILAVALVEYLWKWTGGDPLNIQVGKLRDSISLLKDFKDTGLLRFFRERGEVDFNAWLENIAGAKQVDIFGVVLQANWIENPKFVDLLGKRAAQGVCKFRIIVSEPSSQILAQRAREQRDEIGRLTSEALDTLRVLWDIKQQLPSNKITNLQIRVNGKHSIYSGIIRADHKMLVTAYLSHLRGNNTPTFEIEELSTGRALFPIYAHEFDEVWNTSLEWTNNAKT